MVTAENTLAAPPPALSPWSYTVTGRRPKPTRHGIRRVIPAMWPSGFCHNRPGCGGQPRVRLGWQHGPCGALRPWPPARFFPL